MKKFFQKYYYNAYLMSDAVFLLKNINKNNRGKPLMSQIKKKNCFKC